MLGMVPTRLQPKDIIEGRVLPRTKLRFLERAGVQELERLDTGVLFILAWWSGPAYIALDHLAKAILRADPNGELELLIVDTDGIPELYECDLLRGKIHGVGESIWKRKREVISTLFQRVGEISDYEARIKQLLEPK